MENVICQKCGEPGVAGNPFTLCETCNGEFEQQIDFEVSSEAELYNRRVERGCLKCSVKIERPYSTDFCDQCNDNISRDLQHIEIKNNLRSAVFDGQKEGRHVRPGLSEAFAHLLEPSKEPLQAIPMPQGVTIDIETTDLLGNPKIVICGLTNDELSAGLEHYGKIVRDFHDKGRDVVFVTGGLGWHQEAMLEHLMARMGNHELPIIGMPRKTGVQNAQRVFLEEHVKRLQDNIKASIVPANPIDTPLISTYQYTYSKKNSKYEGKAKNSKGYNPNIHNKSKFHK